MIVKVGKDSYVASNEHPILVIFEDEELEQIRNFKPDESAIYSYPADMDEKKVEAWVNERLNQPPYDLEHMTDEEEEVE